MTTKSSQLASVILMALSLGSPSASQAAIRYVKATASGANNGSSWTNAYTDLRAAVTAAAAGDQVWVASGTYKPTPSADRTVSFSLKNGVRIYGGFPGQAGQENNFAARDLNANVTTLDGDIPGQNSYHVVNANGAASSAVLDGFTIANGSATGTPAGLQNVGGGLTCTGGSPLIVNCTFRDSNALVGGAVFAQDASPTFVNCVFRGNSTIARGNVGGAVYLVNTGNISIINCTIANNTSSSGGGVFLDRGQNTVPSAMIVNSIVWGNTGGQLVATGGSVYTVSHSDVQEATAGSGNFIADPHFIDAANGDFRLAANSPCVEMGVTASLPADSSDSDGDGNTAEQLPIDIIGHTRVVGSAVDVGAYEVVSPTPPPAKPANLIATAAGPDRITLDWNDVVPAPASYSVYRSEVTGFLPGTANRIASGVPNSQYLNTGLSDGVAYYYRVTALDASGGESIPSDEAFAITQPNGQIFYVNDDATGSNDGSSWPNAFTELKSALAAAHSGDQIWVAAGVYKPDYNTTTHTHDGNRGATFALQNGIQILGGFTAAPGSEGNINARITDSDPNTLDPAIDSILSGEIGADGTADNSKHVVSASGVSISAKLDRFTIAYGHADGGGATDGSGGGLNATNSSFTMTDCTFISNYAVVYGAGMEAGGGGGPVITRCNFINNATTSNLNSGGWGGGAHIDGGSTARFTDCLFSGNAASFGGGMESIGSSPRMVHCTFLNNSSDNGAAYRNNGGSTVFVKCTFKSNHVQFYNVGGCSARRGGALFVDGTPRFTDCIFDNNSASRGACGEGYGGAMYVNSGRAKFVNCLLTGNSAADDAGAVLVWPGAAIDLYSCTVTGTTCGTYPPSNGSTLGFQGGSYSTLTNSIIWGNQYEYNGRAIGPCNEIVVKHCIAENILYNGYNGGFGNITGIGWGTGLWDGTLHPYPGSYPYNSGNNSLLIADDDDIDGDGNTAEQLPLDYDGHARISQVTVDMGAFEFQGPQIPSINPAGPINIGVCNSSTCGSNGNTFSLSGNDPDGNSALLTWRIKPGTTPLGQVSFPNGTTGASISVCYTPIPSQNYSDNFVIQVVDSSGLTSEVTVNVETGTGIPPVIQGCPYHVYAYAVGSCDTTATWTPPTATDNCQLASIVGDHQPGETFPSGDTLVTYTATDNVGLTSTCSFVVSVIDAEEPQFSDCPGNITVTADPGQCSAVVNWTAPTVTDNCGVDIQDSNHQPGETFPVGSDYVYYEAYDHQGNWNYCLFYVTVVDGEVPTITGCPSDIHQGTDAGSPTAVVNWTAPTATDNCQLNSFTSNHNPGEAFPVGTTSISYTAKDASNNTSICNFAVIVSDGESPVFHNCPANIQHVLATGECSPAISWTPPTATDNVGVSIFYSDHQPGDTFPPGVTLVTYTAVDGSGHTSLCTFTVTVVDLQAPVFSNCPGNITQSADAGQCGAVVSWIAPTATDNCAGVTLVADHNPGESLPIGTTTVTYTATDAYGNPATCSFDVTVIDDEDPEIAACPGNLTVSASAGACSAAVNWTEPTATDNCPGVILSADHHPGETFPQGPTTVTYTATDGAAHTTTCSFIITVVDDVPPALECPADVNVVEGSSTAPTDTGLATATDNCDPHPSIDFHDTILAATCPQVQIIRRMWTTTDAPGNTQSCTQTIVVMGRDTDGDGTADCQDGCPNDPHKTAPGRCGCGVVDSLGCGRTPKAVTDEIAPEAAAASTTPQCTTSPCGVCTTPALLLGFTGMIGMRRRYRLSAASTMSRRDAKP